LTRGRRLEVEIVIAGGMNHPLTGPPPREGSLDELESDPAVSMANACPLLEELGRRITGDGLSTERAAHPVPAGDQEPGALPVESRTTTV
jgi:hypothetical protein